MPEGIRCSCHISLILILVSLLLWLLGSRVSRSLRRPVSFEDTSNHNGDTRNQWTTGRTVFNSPLQEESCRPAVRYHVKLLLPFLLLLADSKESKSLMADRRTLRDPGQNLYHHLRHRPNLRYSSLIHRCWSCSRSCLKCYEDKYYNRLNVLPVDIIRTHLPQSGLLPRVLVPANSTPWGSTHQQSPRPRWHWVLR